MPRAVITSPTPLLPPAYLAWKKINAEAFFRGHFPSISYHLALLFCACSSSPLVPSTASPRRHSAPATTPETRARGGLSPHCLTHAVLALTAQNNFLTLAFFFLLFFFESASCYVAAWCFFRAPLSPPGPSLQYCCCVEFLLRERGLGCPGCSYCNTMALQLLSTKEAALLGPPIPIAQGEVEHSLQS